MSFLLLFYFSAHTKCEEKSIVFGQNFDNLKNCRFLHFKHRRMQGNCFQAILMCVCRTLSVVRCPLSVVRCPLSVVCRQNNSRTKLRINFKFSEPFQNLQTQIKFKFEPNRSNHSRDMVP